MYKILLVEDDQPLSMGIEFTLKDEGYEVYKASTLEEGRMLFNLEDVDIILLDINLPDGSGYDLCKYIRLKSQTPIIFLTALDEEVNIILGLDIGGDDYITKPFRVRELLSRIKAILRRNSSKSINQNEMDNDNQIKSGDLIINTLNASVEKRGKNIILTAQEYKLLLIFVNKPKALLKRDEILSELIKGEEIFFDENTLSVYIKRIREKIEDNYKEPKYIITQRGMGYKWNMDILIIQK
ncbi:MAG: response regulator transcription factor [Clostridiaceae bacterium]